MPRDFCCWIITLVNRSQPKLYFNAWFTLVLVKFSSNDYVFGLTILPITLALAAADILVFPVRLFAAISALMLNGATQKDSLVAPK